MEVISFSFNFHLHNIFYIPKLHILSQGELKHTRGDVINYFSSKQSIETHNGDEHFVENIGNKKAVLYVFAASAIRLFSTIN